VGRLCHRRLEAGESSSRRVHSLQYEQSTRVPGYSATIEKSKSPEGGYRNNESKKKMKPQRLTKRTAKIKDKRVLPNEKCTKAYIDNNGCGSMGTGGWPGGLTVGDAASRE